MLDRRRMFLETKAILGTAPMLISIEATFGAAVSDKIIAESLKELEAIVGAQVRTPQELRCLELVAAFQLARRKILLEIGSQQAFDQLATIMDSRLELSVHRE